MPRRDAARRMQVFDQGTEAGKGSGVKNGEETASARTPNANQLYHIKGVGGVQPMQSKSSLVPENQQLVPGHQLPPPAPDLRRGNSLGNCVESAAHSSRKCSGGSGTNEPDGLNSVPERARAIRINCSVGRAS